MTDEIAEFGNVYDGDPAELHAVPEDQQLDVDDGVFVPADLSDVDHDADGRIVTFGDDD